MWFWSFLILVILETLSVYPLAWLQGGRDIGDTVDDEKRLFSVFENPVFLKIP